MDTQAGPAPSNSASTTENPVIAVGRKVKSVLSTHQRPSVRIRREPASNNVPRQTGEPSSPKEKVPTDRFSSVRLGRLFSRDENPTSNGLSQEEYDPDTVDLLDVVDPEVSTLSTLTNVQNSLFVPQLGKIVNRQPTYRLQDRPQEARTIDKLKNALKRIADTSATEKPKPEGLEGLIPNDSLYAVLPDGETLAGWSNQDKLEMNDLVRHMLHSRRAKLKRSMKGFGQYVRRPLGLFITVYATLITLFGAAWVLFLIGWISLGSKKAYVVNVVDNVLVALFAIIGDGLAPFRAIDTYHMAFIAHYHRMTWKRRSKTGLPDLVDHNDLPDMRKEDIQPEQVDLESLVARKIPRRVARRVAPRIPKRIARRMVTRNETNNPSYEYSVLSEEEQAKLEYHERRFSKSHTFYKPHETETHFAFPLRLLVAVVVLLDCHSALQITLGACTWGISYKTRPFALTTVVLCCSITCNIMAGVLISVGDKRTRKKEVIERMMRQELTAEAIEQMKTRWMKEAEERGEIDKSYRKKREEEKEDAENEEIKEAWKGVPTLPKKLLGKGEDHRQPSLPQKARKANRSSVLETSGPSETKHSKATNSASLPSCPKAVLRKDDEPSEESAGQKVLRLFRRADLDRS
ncbi:hypothetical protein EV356DRAFT_538066 [Viridothelium virens]|uniref:Integral membrane protein n=1 Tax=Viridothelium virens TaxID=1048519 RepID=A0A6A6GRU6_VIRVR|nr:hypothetical protein EV356DRAFT_538066 [Viridothelium virens]